MNFLVMFLFIIFVLIFTYYADKFLFLLESILETLGEILLKVQPVPGKNSFKFYTIKDGRRERLHSMELSGKEKIEVAVGYSDDFENPAPVENAKLEMSDPSLGDMVVAEDGLSAVCQLNGKAGSFKFVAKGDAKIGEGEVKVGGESEEIVVKPGMATKVKVVAVKIEVAPVE